MDHILRSAQDLIHPSKSHHHTENHNGIDDSGPSPSSSPGGSKGGFMGLLKKKSHKGETDGPASIAISPPESEATSPDLKPLKAEGGKNTAAVPAPITTNTQGLKPISPPLSHPSSPTSPIRSISPPSPPLHARQLSAASAPPTRLSSSSSSQIFERNVQEANPSNAGPAGGKIPVHLATENHIPAVLEASSIAITDDSIDPDSVEIAVLTSHQPVGSQAAHHHHSSSSPEITEDLAPPSTSHSGHSLGPGFPCDNKRRLSFISFSDIVQAEHADLLDSTILSPTPAQAMNSGFQAASVMDQVGISSIQETLVRRSPSPMGRRGVSVSPPRTSAGYLPERGPLAQNGVLVETMGQALRKTGSGDLGKAAY